MFQPHSPFLRDFVARGYLHQCTAMEELDALAKPGAKGGPLIAYIGFDATADSLHVGSLVQIMMLRLLQKSGGKPVVLMGGGTTKVGDPTGRDDMRKVLSDEDIARNIAGIKKIFAQFLTFGDGPTDAIMVNNADWLDKLNYLEFLRDYGRHFSVNRMLGFDSVKIRLEREQPLTFLEFNYMILQAYDFLELSRRYKCALQLGGSDQWGNIVNGVELGRRCDDASLYGLTSPLITLSSGAKMGKSAAGAVWLNEERLSAYDYWQFWRNTEDADVGRFLRLFTDLPLLETERLASLEGAEINEAKIILANEATKLCRGEAAAADAEATARKVFVEGGLGGDLPTIDLSASDIAAGIAAIDLLVLAGLATSKSEARRLIKGNGARLNDQGISDDSYKITLADFNGDRVIKLSAGKKKHVVVRLS
ncbi:tyrosine--tRNA ligase [Dongia mobilis]|jgi:tyrosyl-tRNA synthetase|uniref:tyrosine--tRNA ligase n=1 Tax=Dongia sp. TaxID=1977262 RepID=UPI0026EBC8E1